MEAIKDKWDSWRIWENLLFVSIDIADFETAVRAFNRMMDLRDKYIDIQVRRDSLIFAVWASGESVRWFHN